MKSLEAFQVKATIANESWSTRGTVLTANSETEAAEKAKQVLNLTSEGEGSVGGDNEYWLPDDTFEVDNGGNEEDLGGSN